MKIIGGARGSTIIEIQDEYEKYNKYRKKKIEEIVKDIYTYYEIEEKDKSNRIESDDFSYGDKRVILNTIESGK